MQNEPVSQLRRQPKQQRGQQKVEHILQSAEALFAEVGFENATTNAVAVRAGVAIGSLYQFFSGKEAILAAIADRYLEQTRLAMNEALDPAGELDLHELLEGVVATLVKLQERRPYFLQCLGQSPASPVLRQPVKRLNEAVAARVEALLARGTTETDDGVRQLRARICVEVMGALLPLALRARGAGRKLASDEITALLMRYLEPTLMTKGMI